jgi:rubrerythrin
MSEKSKQKKVLEEAIRFEIDGRDFFIKAVEKAKTYIAKVIFLTIAEEELDHIRRVKKIYESDAVSEKQEMLDNVSEKKDLQNIFQEAKKQMGEGFSVNTDEMEAIRLAIQLEFKGHEFYNRLAQEAVSDFEKKFYQHLAEEELVHFSTLRQMEEAITNSTGFR